MSRKPVSVLRETRYFSLQKPHSSPQPASPAWSILAVAQVRGRARLVVLDWFAFSPAENIAAAPANFAGYQPFFSVILVGRPADAHREGPLAEVAVRRQAVGEVHKVRGWTERRKPQAFLLK